MSEDEDEVKDAWKLKEVEMECVELTENQWMRRPWILQLLVRIEDARRASGIR